jgi:predicted HicB family RNase H-like nuclease
MKKKDHYLKIVEWSEEDQCYVGSIPGWIGKCCHGDNEEDVYRQLCQILDEWIEIYSDDNIPLPSGIADKKYSGKFQLRIDSDVHKALAIRAMQSNESLNSFCGKILRKTILQTGGHLKANNSMNSDC